MEAVYAKKNHPCPICGKQDWCCFLPSRKLELAGDGLYICRRSQTKSDIVSPVNGSVYQYIKDTINGDGIYVLEEVAINRTPTVPIIRRNKKAIDKEPLDNKKLDAVYRRFLGLLYLDEGHYKYFLNQGWDASMIKESLYRSKPGNRSKQFIMDKLRQDFSTLDGVPGFYKAGDDWTFDSRESGILMPLMDTKGQIFRLRQRLDYPEVDEKGKEKNKYKNFASWGESGCSAGMQIGIIENPGDEKETFYITEGEKKAFVGNHYMHTRIVNLTGVNCFRYLLEPNGTEEPILDYLIRTGGKIPIVAFDSDIINNPKVKQAQEALIRLLKNQFDKVGIAAWNSGFGKGLDDILLAGIIPNINYV